MSDLIVSALVRNEAPKYWRSCLESWSQFADKIVVLDDVSTDSTREIAAEFPKVILESRLELDPAAWGKENYARSAQWHYTMQHSKEGDLIFVLDADMVPASDPRDLITEGVDTYAFALYDLWTPSLYREDAFWCGHFNPRVWMVRRPADDFQAKWSDRGVHCGHLPLNLPQERVLYAPRDYSLLHYAYATPEDRESKWAAYFKLGPQLSPGEWGHAQSILDPRPNVKPLPMIPKWPLKRAT